MKFPPLPRTVSGLLGPITVRRVRDLVDDDGNPVGGLWYEEARRITVNIGPSRASSWFFLFHEKAHADFDEFGVKFPTRELEEKACDAVATARIRDMQSALSHRRGPTR